MTTKPESPVNPDRTAAAPRDDRPVQTGALSGGQPGEGVNTSPSKAGQSNMEAVVRQGTEYGKNQPKKD